MMLAAEVPLVDSTAKSKILSLSHGYVAFEQIFFGFLHKYKTLILILKLNKRYGKQFAFGVI